MFPAARSLRSLSQCKGIGRRCLKQAASPAAGPGFCRFFNDFGEGTDNESASQDGDKQTLYKQDLIEMVAIETGLSARNVTKVVNSAIEKIIATVADDNKAVITGFGTFSQIERKARIGRNPQTGEPLQIEARNHPKFKASSTFKRRCN